MIVMTYGTARVELSAATGGVVTTTGGRRVNAENYDPYDLAATIIGVCGTLGYPIEEFKALLDEHTAIRAGVDQ